MLLPMSKHFCRRYLVIIPTKIAGKHSLGVQGKHPLHPGSSDPLLLGTVERYFLEVMNIPRLQPRICCFIFTRTFAPALQQV